MVDAKSADTEHNISDSKIRWTTSLSMSRVQCHNMTTLQQALLDATVALLVHEMLPLFAEKAVLRANHVIEHAYNGRKQYASRFDGILCFLCSMQMSDVLM